MGIQPTLKLWNFWYSDRVGVVRPERWPGETFTSNGIESRGKAHGAADKKVKKKAEEERRLGDSATQVTDPVNGRSCVLQFFVLQG